MIYPYLLQCHHPVYPWQAYRHEVSWATPPSVRRLIRATCTNQQSIKYAILRVNHQILDEAISIFHALNTALMCNSRHESIIELPYGPYVMENNSRRGHSRFRRCSRNQEATRVRLISELYLALFSRFATVRIDFDWTSQARARYSPLCLSAFYPFQTNHSNLRLYACQVLMAMLGPLCTTLLQAESNRKHSILFLLP